MWMFEKRGFISVVAYDPKKDRNKSSKFPEIAMRGKKEYDDSHLLVRARIKEDLDMLKLVVPSLHVETDKSADYSFRAIITRKQMKKFLAMSVDDLNYDSHFKEVARDNSPKAEGRYSAMMSIWSAMAKLQPYSPYGGYSGYSSGYSYGDYGYGGGYGSTYSGKKSSGTGLTVLGHKKGKDDDESPVVTGAGAADMAEFINKYVESGGANTFKTGEGPLTGFVAGDEVIGYFGEGKVTKVQSRGAGKADLVSVTHTKPSSPGSKNMVTKNANFLSNYLMPKDLPEVDEEVEDEDEMAIGDLDMDWVYDYLREKPNAHEFPTDVLKYLDDHAFELLTRVQEKIGEGESISNPDLNQIYDEILWENADDAEKIKMADDGVVPEKYVADAVNLVSEQA